jgi:NurA-like 5'-3' nuclease
MVAEGYCSLDPEKTKGVELAKDFAKQDSAVEECITLTHAEIIDNTIINVNLIALPYVYEIGRNITWLELLTWPTKAEKILRNSEYPKMLENCLRGGVAMDDIPIEAYDELRSTINQNGFYIQELF